MRKIYFLFVIFLISQLFFNCSEGQQDDPTETTTYTITFDKNDADATGTMSPQTIAGGSTANLTANAFIKTDWTFAGWATTADGSVVYADQATYTMGFENVTLYAKWTRLPYVTTENATTLTSTTATLNGQANPNGSTSTGWFRISTTDPGTGNDTFGTRVPASGGSPLGSGTTTMDYSQSITGLTPETTYYYCAIVQNSIGTSFGSVLSFTTSAPSIPSIITDGVTDLTSTTVTLNGQANPNGSTTTGWFRYATASPGTGNDSFGTRVPVTGGSALGSEAELISYSQVVTGLTPETTYYYCTIVQNSIGTSFGIVLSFTTSAPSIPTVITEGVTDLTSTTVTLVGQVNRNGSASTGWFRYDTASPGTGNNTFGTRVPATGGSALGSEAEFIYYTRPVTGLTPGTTYYYCAIAENFIGISFGSVLSFTTP